LLALAALSVAKALVTGKGCGAIDRFTPWLRHE
jgi:hypothetical protein